MLFPKGMAGHMNGTAQGREAEPCQESLGLGQTPRMGLSRRQEEAARELQVRDTALSSAQLLPPKYPSLTNQLIPGVQGRGGHPKTLHHQAPRDEGEKEKLEFSVPLTKVWMLPS